MLECGLDVDHTTSTVGFSITRLKWGAPAVVLENFHRLQLASG